MLVFREEQILKLKKLIKELEAIRGRHTELVSVYIPSGYSIIEVINQLNNEKSTAMNIKSKTTRKNVLNALEKIIQHLRIFKQTPPNGLVVFCGNISPVEGREDLSIWSFEPPEKMDTKVYWCDQVFVLEPLQEMIREKEVYGLIVVDSREADVGLLVGKKIKPIKHLDSTVPSKTVKGGMCLAPDTLVLLENGGHIPIKILKDSDTLLSYDFKNSQFARSVCSDVMIRKCDVAYEIVVDSTRIITTPEHLVFTYKNDKIEEMTVEELDVGDKLFVVKNNKVIQRKIKKKNKIILKENFYDISIPKYENFIANGILVHNSQGRFDRLRADAINEFLGKVGEIASQSLLEQKELKGVIVGGPGPVKEQFIREDYLNYQIKNKILGVKDIGYTGDYGLEELVKKSEDLLEKAAIMKERELLQKFFTELQKEGNVVYGYTETIKALNLNAIDVLLVSEEFDWVRVKLKCDTGHEVERDLPKTDMKTQICEICGREMRIETKDDLGELLSEKALNFGTKVELISTDTTEGRQFKELGGIGGFLRYKID